MIKHILADGTEIKSIEGLTIPPIGKTEAVYRLVAELIANSKPSAAAERPQVSRAYRGKGNQVDKGGIKWNTIT